MTTSAEMIERLRERFCSPAWAFFTEVGNATGFDANRHIDGLAVSLWPSNGLEIHGVEVKVSRGDWLRECKEPAKAEAIARYCDRWWLAVSERDIVRGDELPDGWGLLVLAGDALRADVQAPQRTPLALDRSFMAAVARASWKASPSAREMKQAEHRARDRGRQMAIDGERNASLRRWEESAARIRELETENAALRHEAIGLLDRANARSRRVGSAAE